MVDSDPATTGSEESSSGQSTVATDTPSRRRIPGRRTDEERQNEERAKKREQARKARQRRIQEDRERRAADEHQQRVERASEEALRNATSRGWRMILIALGVIFLGFCGVVAGLGHKMTLTDRDTILAATAAGAVGLFLIMLGLAVPPLMQARGEIRRREREAREKARHALDEISEATDLAALIVGNRKQMDAYDDLARLQSRESFRNSQIAIGIGLLAFITGGVVSLAAQDTTAQITTATLAGLAGALSGYIGKTFLRVYDRAQKQLTFFFQQPLITSYLLNAERIVEKMNEQDAERSRLVQYIMDFLVTVPDSLGDLSGHGNKRRGRDGSKGNGNGAQPEPGTVTEEALPS